MKQIKNLLRILNSSQLNIENNDISIFNSLKFYSTKSSNLSNNFDKNIFEYILQDNKYKLSEEEVIDFYRLSCKIYNSPKKKEGEILNEK
jgi:hypothetical protein